MRILFLLPDFPYPPDSGGKSKIFSLLKVLATENKCDILCFGKKNIININKLSAVNKNIRTLDVININTGYKNYLLKAKNCIFGLPASFSEYQSKEYIVKLNNYLLIYKYDIVHLDIINMAQFRRFINNIPTIHSPNDATSLIYSRIVKNTSWSLSKIKLILSTYLLRKYEKNNYSKFSKIIVTSNSDYEYLQKLDLNICIETVPIAIDEKFILNRKKILDNEKKVKSLKIVCVGDLENNAIKEGVYHFIEKSFPMIVKKYPFTHLTILSKNAMKDAFNLCSYKSNIKLINYVNNYIEFITSFDIVLVPDKYGPDGIKTRTLQALALGMPVIGTPTGFSGLPIKNGKHGLIYKSIEECTDLLMALIGSRKKQIELGENGHKLILNNFSTTILGAIYKDIYTKLIK